MPIAPYVPGTPGVRALKTAAHRIVFKGGFIPDILPQGRLIDGSKSRDPLNVGDETVLRPGVLMGKITASGKYAPSILGVTTVAYTSGGTSLTVSPATAVELVRRIGTSGTFITTGPPTSGGTVAATATTFSAVNTTTGVITVTSLGVDKIAGSLIQPDDGSDTIRSLIGDVQNGYGITVVDSDGSTNIDQQWPDLAIAGLLITANIVNYGSNAKIQAYIKAALNAVGKFEFDDDF